MRSAVGSYMEAVKSAARLQPASVAQEPRRRGAGGRRARDRDRERTFPAGRRAFLAVPQHVHLHPGAGRNRGDRSARGPREDHLRHEQETDRERDPRVATDPVSDHARALRSGARGVSRDEGYLSEAGVFTSSRSAERASSSAAILRDSRTGTKEDCCSSISSTTF